MSRNPKPRPAVEAWGVEAYVLSRIPLPYLERSDEYKNLVKEYLAAFPNAMTEVNQRFESDYGEAAIEAMQPPILEWIRAKGYDILDRELSPYAGMPRKSS